MKHHTRDGILDRLREGPLASDAFQGLAASRKALHVQIHNLRRLGYPIESEPNPDRVKADGTQNVRCTRYVLQESA